MARTLVHEKHRIKVQSLIHKFLDAFIDFKHQSLKEREILPATDLNIVQTFCSLYETLATPENGVDPADEVNFDIMVNSWFWFCLVWSIGGTLDDEGRREADSWIREIESPFPPKDTVYDYYVDVQKHGLLCWEDKLPTIWKRPADLPFNKVPVPTIDTLRNSFLLQTTIQGKKNILFISASGKTAFIENTLLTAVYANAASLTIILSSRTSSNKIQYIIEKRMLSKSGQREHTTLCVSWLLEWGHILCLRRGASDCYSASRPPAADCQPSAFSADPRIAPPNPNSVLAPVIRHELIRVDSFCFFAGRFTTPFTSFLACLGLGTLVTFVKLK